MFSLSCHRKILNVNSSELAARCLKCLESATSLRRWPHTQGFLKMCCAAVNCKIVCKICSTVVKKVIKLFIVDSFFSRAANFCWNEVVRALLGRRQRFVEWCVPGGAEARDSVPHSKPVFCPALRRLARRLSQQSHHQRRNDAAVGCRPRWNREFFCQSQQLTFLSLISDAKFTPSDSTGRNCFTWRRVGVGGVTWTITPGLIYKISYDNFTIILR